MHLVLFLIVALVVCQFFSTTDMVSVRRLAQNKPRRFQFARPCKFFIEIGWQLEPVEQASGSPGGGVLPSMGYTGMCHGIGYGF